MTKTERILFWLTATAVGVMTLASCMTPGQAETVVADVTHTLMQKLAAMVTAGDLSAEQFTMIVTALKEAGASAVATVAEAGIDWGMVTGEIGKLAGTALVAVTGVNVMRNRARTARGEPTGGTPTNTLAPNPHPTLDR